MLLRALVEIDRSECMPLGGSWAGRGASGDDGSSALSEPRDTRAVLSSGGLLLTLAASPPLREATDSAEIGMDWSEGIC